MDWPRSAHQPLRRTFDTAKPRALLLWAGRVVHISPSAALSIQPSPMHSPGRFRSVAASVSLLKNEPRPASSDKFTNPNAVGQYIQKILKPTSLSAAIRQSPARRVNAWEFTAEIPSSPTERQPPAPTQPIGSAPIERASPTMIDGQVVSPDSASAPNRESQSDVSASANLQP
jgi:hypothetical protein